MLSQKHPEPACCQKGTLCSEVNSTSLRGPAALSKSLLGCGIKEKMQRTPGSAQTVRFISCNGPPITQGLCVVSPLGPGPFQTRCLARFLSPERNSGRAEGESGRGRRGAVTQQRNRSQGPAFHTCRRCVLPPVPATCPQLTAVAACSESL